MGRPPRSPLGVTRRTSISISASLIAALDREARRLKISRSALIQRCVEQARPDLADHARGLGDEE